MAVPCNFANQPDSHRLFLLIQYTCRGQNQLRSVFHAQIQTQLLARFFAPRAIGDLLSTTLSNLAAGGRLAPPKLRRGVRGVWNCCVAAVRAAKPPSTAHANAHVSWRDKKRGGERKSIGTVPLAHAAAIDRWIHAHLQSLSSATFVTNIVTFSSALLERREFRKRALTAEPGDG